MANTLLSRIEKWKNYSKSVSKVSNNTMDKLVNDFSDIRNFRYTHFKNQFMSAIIYLSDCVYIRNRTNKLALEQFIRRIEKEFLPIDYSNEKLQLVDVFNELRLIETHINNLAKKYQIELFCKQNSKNQIEIGICKLYNTQIFKDKVKEE